MDGCTATRTIITNRGLGTDDADTSTRMALATVTAKAGLPTRQALRKRGDDDAAFIHNRRRYMAKGKKTGDLIISKTRTKTAAKRCNVSADFYGALDQKVRELIEAAEARAIANKRKTLKPADL